MSRLTRRLRLAASLLPLPLLVTAPSGAIAQTNVAPEVVIEAERTDPNAVPVTPTTAGPVRGWQPLTARSATRTDAPITETPQSITVIPRSVIDEQGAVTQAEAMRNAAGVQPLTPLFFSQLGPTVRGFPGARYVDGLPNYYDPGARDLLVGIERIEVLRGPAALLHQGGSNTIGGIVNVVTVAPLATPHIIAGLLLGTNRTVSPWIDINTPLNGDKTVLFRFTGQWERAGSSIDFIERDSYTLNPSIRFTNNNGTSFTLSAHVSRREQPDYPGLPAVGTIDRSLFSIRRDLFASARNVPEAWTEAASLTGRFEHVFNDVWSFDATARVGRGLFREPSQFVLGNTPFLPPSTFGQWNGYLTETTTEMSLAANLLAKFEAFGGRHRLLFGTDINRVTDRGRLDADLAGLVDFDNPVFPPYVQPVPGPFTTFTNIDNVYTNLGLTAQIHSTFAERLHILAGVRLGQVDIVSRELTIGSQFHTRETKLLPRLGAAYEVFNGVTLFASYSEGLRPVPFFNGPTAPKPEESELFEAGVKLDLGFGLSGTFAYFDLVRTNVPVPNPLVPGQQIQQGEQRSTGFEADVIWQPNRNWAFLASYAYTDAEVTRDTGGTVGNQLTNAPRYSGRFWATYRFTEGAFAGLSLGAGVTAVSRQPVNIDNDYFASGYALIDARIAYEWKNYTLAMMGKNLADYRGYVPYPFLDGRVAPVEGRTIYTSLTARF